MENDGAETPLGPPPPRPPSRYAAIPPSTAPRKKAAAPPKGVPYRLDDPDAPYKRHVVDADVRAADFTNAERQAIETGDFRYHDPISDGNYQEIETTPQQRYDVAKRAEQMAKIVDAQLAARMEELSTGARESSANEAAAQRRVRVVQPPPSSQVTIGAHVDAPSVVNHFPRQLFDDPVHCFPREIWGVAQHLINVRRIHTTYISERNIRPKQRVARPFGDYNIQALQAGLTLRTTSRIRLFSSVDNILHLTFTLFGKLDSESADASEMDVDNLGTGVDSGEEVPIDNIPSLLEDRMRVIVLLKPSDKPMPLMAAHSGLTEDMMVFDRLAPDKLHETCTLYSYQFVCFFYKLI